MTRRSKLWIGLGSAVLAGSAGPALAGNLHNTTALVSGAPAAPAALAGDLAAEPVAVQLAAGEGGEGGEGGAAAAAPATDDTAFLTQLALIRGHLDVGVELYRRGAVAAAKTHMKHPEDELYADLAPAFAARHVAGFKDSLERLAGLVEAGAPVAQVEAAYADLLRAIDTAASRGAPAAAVATKAAVVLALVRKAAEDYAKGVSDGRVTEAHEYQDALGFVRSARSILRSLSAAEKAKHQAVLAEISGDLDSLAVAWPSVVPPGRVDADASLLYGTAARIEIASLKLH